MNEPWFYAIWIIGAYLLGNVSMGDLVARAAGVDIRSLGTGNPGAANIYREIGLPYAIAVFALDAAKGIAATAPLYVLDLPSWSGLLAMAALFGGHLFPIFWRFQGGTGMAVAMGTTVGLLPLGVPIAALPALLVVRVTGNPGYGGVTFFAVVALAGGVIHRDMVGVLAVLVAGAIILVKARVQYQDQ